MKCGEEYVVKSIDTLGGKMSLLELVTKKCMFEAQQLIVEAQGLKTSCT